MSLIIAVNTYEGIVMASDSRSTGSFTHVNPDGSIRHALGSQITDTTYKTFLYNDRIGISTCGDGSINNIPIAKYIERFISQKRNNVSTVESISNDLVDFFDSIAPKLRLHFFIAGYEEENIVINQIKLENANIDLPVIEKINTSVPGAFWDGEFLTLSKLLNPMYIKNQDQYISLPTNEISWQYFTLQDAIDFAKYAVDVTIKTMAFQNCVKTVDGPIDILVIKPDKAFWIACKELHA